MNRLRKSRPLDGLSILILEDEFLVAIAMEDDFRAAGAKTALLARTIAEARTLLQMKPDCAVLDLRVPDGLSLDLAHDLIAAGTAVVFHSGHAEADDLSEVPGAVVCSKPSLPCELVQAIARAVQIGASSEEAVLANAAESRTRHPLRRRSLG